MQAQLVWENDMSKGEPGSALEKLVRSVMQHVAGILHPQSGGDGERPEHTVSNAAEQSRPACCTVVSVAALNDRQWQSGNVLSYVTTERLLSSVYVRWLCSCARIGWPSTTC